MMEPPIDGGLYNIGKDDGREQSDECGEAHAADGGMNGEEHAAHRDEQRDGREQNSGLMEVEKGTLNFEL